jgi:acetate kinase
MRRLLASREPGAQLAVDYFVYGAAKAIGALAAVLGGIDGLVFTAGSVSAWVIPTNEELMIARHTAALLEPIAAMGLS